MKTSNIVLKCLSIQIFFLFPLIDVPAQETMMVHVWETVEITLEAEQNYANGYTDVSCWADLEGPGFAKRIYGFWDGGKIYKIRLVATAPGSWRWITGSTEYEGQTTAYDMKETDCEELAADFEQDGECEVNSDWIAE